MLNNPLLIPPGPGFWPQVARILLGSHHLAAARRGSDLSEIRVLVPGFAHAQALKAALGAEARQPLIPPRITTLPAWLSLLPPQEGESASATRGERMMSLYAELRQHAWLKKLFTARRNTDLLPLAQTLLTLFDELSAAMLPAMRLESAAADERWESALEQLPPPVRELLSDEAQLVWTLWKTQLDRHDPLAASFEQMLRLAENADAPLVWIHPARPEPLQEAFLQAYAQRRPVLPVTLDWHADAVAPAFALGWEEMLDPDPARPPAGDVTLIPGLSLHAAGGLEAEAQHAAQTVVDWLAAGKGCVAVIAQDRVVARRVRALLERAEVFVADETGWKLSTTRSAAGLAALLDVVTTHAETAALLDLLKAPCLLAQRTDKADRVMEIERALLRRNVTGGWDAALAALDTLPEARALLALVAEQARSLAGRRTLGQWGLATGKVLEALGMRQAMETDAAGAQVIALLDMLLQDCAEMDHPFSFAEWRAFLSLQLESTPFVPEHVDRRVVMLQLNGAQLRSFDAVLMVGADAAHLPSQLNETLFFANGVRRELGLATREQMQRMQLRDFAELLTSSPEVVLSWQAQRDGEPNAVSNWIERLQLVLARAAAGRIPPHVAPLAETRLQHAAPQPPAPCAPQLLPRKLSASGYNSLVACPYQFFASRMLKLDVLEELSDMPEKRDYGEWLHAILRRYHERLREQPTPPEARPPLLQAITEEVFAEALSQGGAALGYYTRWQKAMPAYLEWANAREAQGWRFLIGEQHFEKILLWDGGQITLHGYVDRIDENAEGERAVLDYKTRNVQSLREKLKEAEDHQLAFYGLLSDLPVHAGTYVALELTRDKTGDAEAKQFRQWQALLEERIVATLRDIGAGAPLPASGIERVCAYCEMRGLCRKGAW
ncbi:MAG TPA: PD-(D/E)XK nuclease family protein [Noviherbaspirillum sp.]|jgi:ATP-dependent helicase/nuclease subunit B|uniref:PD-(D/E)XK nuclease family protein n=1 Tax=Noviherbaspirillum sp. TaxID=1926288 RepID=UPI002F927542